MGQKMGYPLITSYLGQTLKIYCGIPVDIQGGVGEDGVLPPLGDYSPTLKCPVEHCLFSDFNIDFFYLKIKKTVILLANHQWSVQSGIDLRTNH